MSVNVGQPVSRYLSQALQGLRMWSLRRWGIALALSVVIGVALGIVTVLIPNPVFHRDIPPTVWSYPVWVVTSLLSGMLMATYVKEREPGEVARSLGSEESSSSADLKDEATERSSFLGMVGTFGAWFAIGCPVCNKLALLALGYSGAITYFAPLQPWLAGVSLALLLLGLIVRLSGEVACPVPARA